jgi:hypothetical protein
MRSSVTNWAVRGLLRTHEGREGPFLANAVATMVDRHADELLSGGGQWPLGGEDAPFLGRTATLPA